MTNNTFFIPSRTPLFHSPQDFPERTAAQASGVQRDNKIYKTLKAAKEGIGGRTIYLDGDFGPGCQRNGKGVIRRCARRNISRQHLD